MDESWDEVPILSRDPLNENEQRALGGWFVVGESDPTLYDFIQTEVPLGIHRSAATLNRSVSTDLSRSELLAGRDIPRGFHSKKDVAAFAGSGTAAGTVRADVVMVKKSEIHLVEIKTSQESIDGATDAHKAFGQLMMYLDRFEEDYPSLADTHDLHGLILAEDSTLDPRIIEPSFLKRDLGFFDPARGGYLIKPTWA